MKKILYIAAAATLALASCSSESDMAEQNPENENGLVAVEFANPYLANNTRATVETLATLQATNAGFGVYAYEQGTAGFKTYSSNSSYPNFFYNQKVSWDNGVWKYSPVKYFSNNKDAKHSFFAYAPHKADVKTVFAIGNAPAIRYAASDDYDLLYAAAVKDMTKPDVASKIQFNFKHALSQVNFYVAPFVDKAHETTGHTTGDALDANTTIVVRSVKFVGTVASQGLMSLEDGSWTFEATEESAYELNDPIILDKNNMTTLESENKYATVKENMMVIPTQADKKVKIQVIYDVITKDPNSAVNSSTITNKVESVDEFALVQGTAYNFYLDLGMTTVKFAASVAEWGAPTKENVDLPNNFNYAGLTYCSCPSAASAPANPVANEYYYNTESKKYFKCTTAGSWDSSELTIANTITYNPTDGKYYDCATTPQEVNLSSLSTGYYVINGLLYYKAS